VQLGHSNGCTVFLLREKLYRNGMDGDDNGKSPPVKKNVEKIKVVFPPDAVGRLLFNKYVDDNTQKFLVVLRGLTSRHKTPEIAKDYLEYIIKVATKVAFLYKQKQVAKEQIVGLRFIFRRMCSSITNSFRVMDIQPVDETRLKRISSLFKKFKTGVCDLLGPFISDRSLAKVTMIFEYFSSQEFLSFCFQDPDNFKEIVYVLSYYLDSS